MSLKSKLKSLFTVDEEFEYDYEYVEDQNLSKKQMDRKQDEKNVVNLSSLKQPTSKVVLCEPRTYNEAQEIADHLVNRRSVVINLERIDRKQARRIIDFLGGTVYAINGSIQKLGSQTFLCTPDNVEISGSITESYPDDEFNKGW